MFAWHNETTLKSFGRLSGGQSEKGEKEPQDPPIAPDGAASRGPPEEEDEAATVIRSLEA